MSNSKWKNNHLAAHIIDLINNLVLPSEDAEPKSGFRYGFKGHSTHFDAAAELYEDLLIQNTRFNNEVPQSQRDYIVRSAIFGAADKGRLNQGSVSEYIRSGENEYLNRPKTKYILLTTLSIPYGSYLKPIKLKKSSISFCKRKPRNFDTSDAELVARKICNSELIDQFTYVRVSVYARCKYSAYDQAKEDLDFIRGVWNFTYNLSSGMRKSYGIPDRINKIVYGPCHTVHREDGSTDDSIYWYETHLSRKATFTDIRDSYSLCKKNERAIRKLVDSKPIGSMLRIALIRYNNALDDDDMTSAFMRLWSVLEFLTITDKDTHNDVIHRAAQVFRDKTLKKAMMDNLRQKRNHIVHTGGEYHTAESDTFTLLQTVNALMMFLINNIHRISSREDFIELLSLPLDKEGAQKQKQELTKLLDKFKLADEIGLYSA